MSNAQVTPGGDRRSVTMTVELHGGRLRTLVAESQRRLATRCLKLYGRPVRLLSLSTPDTIYADLSGDPRPPMVSPYLAAIFEETPNPSSGRKGETNTTMRRERARLFDE